MFSSSVAEISCLRTALAVSTAVAKAGLKSDEFIVPPCGKLDWSPAAKAAGRKTNRRAGQCSERLQCLAPLHPSCLAEAAGLLRQRPYSLPLGQGQSGPVTSSCIQDSPQGRPFPAQQTQKDFLSGIPVEPLLPVRSNGSGRAPRRRRNLLSLAGVCYGSGGLA